MLSENLFEESRLACLQKLDLDACERPHEKVYDDLKNEYLRCDAASCVGEQNSEIVTVLSPIHILSESGKSV